MKSIAIGGAVFFSKDGKLATEIVFAGYGIVAPKDGDQEEYDSYVHLGRAR